jgi:hypothetical protein
MTKFTKLSTVSVLLLVQLLFSTTRALAPVISDSCDGTRLVVLAGPRRTGTSSVAEYFTSWARGAQPNHQKGKLYHPLEKIRWPLVYGEVSNKTETEYPYKRFNHLVTDPDNEPLRTEIMDAIKRDYDQAGVKTVIFGGEEFDQVGASAPSGIDATKAVQDVVDYTGASPGCVTILINYRVPRFEQWVSIYTSRHEEEDDESFVEYDQHMCQDETSALRMQELGTSMNPMYMAETYLKAGDEKWNVQMIDMGGVAELKSDITAIIGCMVLGAACTDNGKWVKGHLQETPEAKKLEKEIETMTPREQEQSESLLLYRDCAYEEDLLQNDRFTVLANSTIWADCTHDEDHEWIYQSFRPPREGTHLVFDGLLSQVNCEKYGGYPAFNDQSRSEALEAAKIEDFLNGEYQHSHNFLARVEEAIEDGHFSGPMVLVVLMFAGGISFYLIKMRENPDYEVAIPGFELSSKSWSPKRGKSKEKVDADDSDSEGGESFTDEPTAQQGRRKILGGLLAKIRKPSFKKPSSVPSSRNPFQDTVIPDEDDSENDEVVDFENGSDSSEDDDDDIDIL